MDEDLPPHIAEALAAISIMQERHERGSRPVQRSVERLTKRFARPGTVFALVAISLGWMLVNVALHTLGWIALDPPPFDWLQLGFGLTSIALTCMILTTQRRDDILAGHRAHLTLELAILAERKSAKAIALLEELRQDLPQLENRVDEDAAAMAEPTDPCLMLDALVRDQDPEVETTEGS